MPPLDPVTWCLHMRGLPARARLTSTPLLAPAGWNPAGDVARVRHGPR